MPAMGPYDIGEAPVRAVTGAKFELEAWRGGFDRVGTGCAGGDGMV